MRVLFNMEPDRVPWLDAPTIFDFTTTEEQRQVLTFFAGNTRQGRQPSQNHVLAPTA